MNGLLQILRNFVSPAPFRFTVESSEDPSKDDTLLHTLQVQCPHLMGAKTASPSRLLPSGDFQTIFSAFADFSHVDRISYKRKVFLTPDGGTLSLDICA